MKAFEKIKAGLEDAAAHASGDDARAVSRLRKGRACEDAALLNMVLARIRRAAEAGERAPLNSEIRGGTMVINALVARGDIRVEVYGKNWRVIEIKATGQRTKESPIPGKPYFVNDRSVT